MKNSREVCVDIIGKVLNEYSYSNIVLKNELNKNKFNDNDKGLITEIVYGTIKYRYAIDMILNSFIKKGIDSIDEYIVNVLRISVYQIRYLDKIPNFAVVNEAVEITKKNQSIGASKLVNGVLRNYLRNLDKEYYDDNNIVETLCFKYSFDKWLVKLFIKQYGTDVAEKILAGLNMRPAVTVRVNALKGEYDEVYDKLVEEGYNVQEGYVCPEAVIITRGKNIEDNPLFREGFITVQDESAMLVAPSMGLKDNMTVLDLCSAPGGKTTHISEIMNNTGEVKAFDIYENKLKLVKHNAKRLGMKNLQCYKMDASEFNEELKDSSDAVLIDVPCSGLGIIRKKPEIKYTKDLKGLNDLVDIQRKIICTAANYVKIGGVLLYSTCTLNQEENENNVRWFLNNNPQFKIEKLYYGNLDNFVYSKEGCLTILPNEYMDGFFITKLIRQW